MTPIPPYIAYSLTLAFSAAISALAIPRIIYIAKRKRLFDHPDNERKMHEFIVPNLGGIGIFFAYIIAACLFIDPIVFHTDPNVFHKWNYIVAATLILFLTGLKDDLISLPPSKKFAAQFVAAAIMAFCADIRIKTLFGVMGIHELPYWISIGFTIVGCVFVTNAFNLIDGIDGLAGSIGVLCTISLGIFLALQKQSSAACIAFSMAGALIGFLRYNISPAEIFMGDTGSLVVGFTISMLSILFVNTFDAQEAITPVVHSSSGALVIVLAILVVPVLDSLRVFTTRAMKGGSPFRADRSHLHHYLLDLGFSHNRTVLIIVTANFLIIAVSLFVQDYNPNIALAVIVSVSFFMFGVLYYMRRHRILHDERYLKVGKSTLHPKTPIEKKEI
ncbi:MAG: MraY family glycosyltransferase [Bacteroidota bacterium]